jgi:hypothetical protein
MKYIRTYIRTKDNIYEECARERCPNGCVITTSGVRVPYTDILRESNSIEELCDGYYLDIDNHPWQFDFTQIYDKGELQKVLEERTDWQNYSDRKGLEYKINLYGFIKTDKGLIFVAKINTKYVAKTNIKGNWELL